MAKASAGQLLRVAGVFILNLAAAVFGPAVIESSVWSALPRARSFTGIEAKEWLLGLTAAALLGFFISTLAIQGRCLGLDCSGAVFCTWGASILRKADKQRASQRRFLEAFFRSRLLRDELSRLPRFYGTGRPCGGVFRGSMGVPSPSASKRMMVQIYGTSLRWTGEGG